MKKLLMLLIASFFLLSCGRKGALVPPESLVPPAVADLRVEQKGDHFLVSWGPPARQKQSSTKDGIGYALYRREVLPPGEDCEECPNAYRLVKEVQAAYQGGIRLVAGRLYWDDTGVLPGKVYQYKVVAVRNDGAASAASSRIRHAVLTPPPPPRITAGSSVTGVELDWEAVTPPAGTEVVGYHVYRRRSGELFGPAPLTAVPWPAPPFEDLRLELATSYVYAVRTVARIGGVVVESSLSNEVVAGLAGE